MWITAFLFCLPEILSILHRLMNAKKYKNLQEKMSIGILNKKHYINAGRSQHFEMSKILSDTLRTKNNYKYAIHFSDAFSLNVPLWTVSILFEGGKALINPVQWIIHCCMTEVAYMIILYMGKWLCFFCRRKKQYYLDSSNSYFGKEKQVEPSLALYLRNLLFFPIWFFW